MFYVDASIEGKAICPMLDMGATYNFIDMHETKHLGLKLSKGISIIKAVNLEEKLIHGIAEGVEV